MRSPNTMRGSVAALASAILLVAATAAQAATITPVGPFAGTFDESFEQFSLRFQLPSISILDGTATLTSNASFIYNLNTEPFGIGIIDSNDSATITFSQPVSAFGGFWGSGSPSNGITFQFFDSGNNLLGTIT